MKVALVQIVLNLHRQCYGLYLTGWLNLVWKLKWHFPSEEPIPLQVRLKWTGMEQCNLSHGWPEDVKWVALLNRRVNWCFQRLPHEVIANRKHAFCLLFKTTPGLRLWPWLGGFLQYPFTSFQERAERKYGCRWALNGMSTTCKIASSDLIYMFCVKRRQMFVTRCFTSTCFTLMCVHACARITDGPNSTSRASFLASQLMQSHVCIWS